jgi:glycosyltransferase involved in cell wall biosynthesis
MVTTFYPPRSFGGDGIAVQSLSRALVRAGHEVEVVCDDDAFRTLSGDHSDAPPEVDDGIIVHRMRSRFGAVAVTLTQQTGRPVVHGTRLRRVLEGGRFDVIHFHNISLVGGPAVLSLGDAVKFYTAHEHWLVCPTHVLWRHGKEPCPSRECIRCQTIHRRPPQLWRHTGLLEEQVRQVDAFIAVSEFSRAKHHEFGFAPAMEVIPGFARDPGAPTRPMPAAGERPYFLFAGRLETIKGLDDVIDLFGRFDGADLHIVGSGTQRERLEARAASNPRVKFLGFKTGAALEACYDGATAVIASSIGFETFGMSVIEAFSRGVPVLARHIGSFVELVDGSGAGETFATIEQLESQMSRLVADRHRRETMGRTAYERFVSHYSEQAVLPRYLTLVERHLGGSVASSMRPTPPSMPVTA